METIDIQYRFAFPNGSEERFELKLDADTLRRTTIASKEPPDWTRIEFCQCPNCPLDAIEHPHCPLAIDLTDVVERFNQLLSYDRMRVTVVTKEREIASETTAQRGLSSLLGLLMAVSECPLTDFFKPMARFHLPFSSMTETAWRVVGTYLMTSYYANQDGHFYTPSFEKLNQLYQDIQIVNINIAERLRAACQRDSMLNALILLDTFAKCIPLRLDDSLRQIRRYFTPLLGSQYFDEADL